MQVNHATIQFLDYISKTIAAYDASPDKFVTNTDVMVNELEMRKMLKLLQSKDATILDIGCGSGKDAQRLVDMGYKVTGIDLSEGLLEKARQLHPGIDLRKMDMRQLDFDNEAFDAIWCNATLLHLNDEDIRLTLKEISRVLKLGGVLAVSFKEGSGSKEVLETFSTDLVRFYTFQTIESLNTLLGEAGFMVKDNTRLNERERFGSDKRDLNWVWAFAVKPIN